MYPYYNTYGIFVRTVGVIQTEPFSKLLKVLKGKFHTDFSRYFDLKTRKNIGSIQTASDMQEFSVLGIFSKQT